MTARLLTALAVTLACLTPLVADDKKEKDPAPVSGKFVSNGKEAKLAFASAAADQQEKDYTVLIFTEKDHAGQKSPQTAAVFNKCGSALVITVNGKGKVVGCEVAHEGNKKGMFNDIGRVEVKEFKSEGGVISGKLTSGGELETFGDKWQLDLTFSVKKK